MKSVIRTFASAQVRLVRLTVLLLCLTVGSATLAGPSLLKRDYDTTGEKVREAFKPVVADARQSVVQVRVRDRVTAMGVIVSADGLVLTKASEVRGDEPVSVTLSDLTTVDAERIADDGRSDLALLRIDAEDLTPITFAEDAALQLGQWVVVPGLDELPLSVGVLSVKPRRVSGVRLGVALFDMQEGPVIRGTIEGMGAEQAGLRRGDRIVSVEGKAVENTAMLVERLRGYNVGDHATIVVEREGEELSFDVEMRSKPIDRRDRTDRMNTLSNDMSVRRDGFDAVMQHDATLDPNQCGGPLLDLEGRCIGINIARAGRVEAFALPATLVERTLANLTGQMLVNQEAQREEAPAH